MRRLSAEAGFTLTDTLVAITLMIVVLGATLTVFDAFVRHTRTNGAQNDAQDRARFAVDGLARDLRNQSSPSPDLLQGIERPEDDDIVAQTVGSQPSPTGGGRVRQRVRYCVDSSATNGRLWRQIQTWPVGTAPPPLPASQPCPDGTWGTATVAADRLVNRGSNRPALRYVRDANGVIREVVTDLLVDVDPQHPPAAARLVSGVFLRNENRPPDPPTVTVTPDGPGRWVLNGSASTDPDGDPLTYAWLDASGASCDPTHAPVLTYSTGMCPQGPPVKVVVKDPGGLTNQADLSPLP